ncbi:DoxX family protein [Sphingobacterium siyangense]|uniref:DoxX family protein n=1 Tax=Sphingobacterium siyangense TaxID=459529 RepID=UPI003DA1CB74
MAIWNSLGKYRDTGLLVLRVGLGVMMIMHGLPKLQGGPELWAGVGKSMGNIGIHFMPTFWGFMAAATETVGGLFLLLGLFFRPVALLLAFTMVIAGLMHLSKGDGISGASHAIELCFVFLGLILVGPGKHSVDKK